MVRRRFSEITTRRLGTRGQSKYHYYGLGVRQTSKYYDPEANGSHSTYPSMESQVDASMSMLPSFSVFKSKSPLLDHETQQDAPTAPKRQNIGIEVEAPKDLFQENVLEKENQSNIPRRSDQKLEKAFAALRTFPSSFDLFVPNGISYDKLDTFLLMYKTHCHRMIDAILCSDFSDIQVYLNHFWTEIPEHLVCLLETDFLSRVVETCDNLFYEVSQLSRYL